MRPAQAGRRIVISLALLGSLCFAADSGPGSESFQQRLNTARQLYYKGIEGSKDAGKQSDDMFGQLYRESPDQPLVEAYYGSLRLLEAAKTWALWRKNALSKEGLTLMDKAVSSAPQNPEVRFLRAVTTYHLPSFFGRKQQSAEDFAMLAPNARESARTGALHPSLAAAVLFYHGQFSADRGDRDTARQAWRSAIEVAPQSIAGKDAADRLKKLR